LSFEEITCTTKTVSQKKKKKALQTRGQKPYDPACPGPSVLANLNTAGPGKSKEGQGTSLPPGLGLHTPSGATATPSKSQGTARTS